MRVNHGTDNEKLKALRQAYLQMPNGGMPLNVTEDGKIHNSFVIVETFKSKSSAFRQLRKAGFLPTKQGWRIYEVANLMNASNGRDSK